MVRISGATLALLLVQSTLPQSRSLRHTESALPPDLLITSFSKTHLPTVISIACQQSLDCTHSKQQRYGGYEPSLFSDHRARRYSALHIYWLALFHKETETETALVTHAANTPWKSQGWSEPCRSFTLIKPCVCHSWSTGRASVHVLTY